MTEDRGRVLLAMREDRRAIGSSWKVVLRPGFHAVVAHRLRQAVEADRGLPGSLGRPLVRGVSSLVRTLYQIDIAPHARIGRRFVVNHQTGIFVGPNVEIGDDCVIENGVSIGGEVDAALTLLGDDVRVGSGSSIEAGVRIGSGARIAPNSVVVSDVPEGARVEAPASTVRPPRRRATGDDSASADAAIRGNPPS